MPPSGGNARYALVALLLLGGVGGLVWFRRSSTEAPASAPAASATAQPSASVNAKLEDVPPPPPPEPSEEPAKNNGPTGPKIIYLPATAGCEGKCGGTAPPELGQALAVRGNQARRCYNQALAQDSTLKGHVTLNVRIGPTGNFCSATVASNDMGSPGVANCAANIFRAAGTYPSPRGGCVDAKVPLSFVPQGQ